MSIFVGSVPLQQTVTYPFETAAGPGYADDGYVDDGYWEAAPMPLMAPKVESEKSTEDADAGRWWRWRRWLTVMWRELTAWEKSPTLRGARWASDAAHSLFFSSWSA